MILSAGGGGMGLGGEGVDCVPWSIGVFGRMVGIWSIILVSAETNYK